MKQKQDTKWVIVDIETSGSEASRDRVIEIGMLVVENWEVKDEWSTLINPNRSIPPFITTITGITNETVAAAPQFGDVMAEFLSRVNGRTFIAHNARFDYGFLQYEIRRQQQRWQSPHACSVKLSRRLYPGYRRHGLDQLIERFNLPVDSRHRALGDAKAVWEFLKISRLELGQEAVEAAMKEMRRTPSLPLLLDPRDVEALPEHHGVYFFFDEFKQPLYVGKSVNVKERVKSHFYSDLVDKKELRIKERLAAVKTVSTAGELDSLLLEASLVKKLQPEYNRKLKQKKGWYVLKLEKNEAGYLETKMALMPEINSGETRDIFGVFQSKSHMAKTLERLASEARLCKKLLGLEKGKKACFGYQLQSCLGACLGKEPAAAYNARLLTAMETFKIKDWPYDGPVGISETNEVTGESAIHVFEQWCYLGKGETEEEARELASQPDGRVRFDFDKYRILRSYLAKQGEKLRVVPIVKMPGSGESRAV